MKKNHLMILRILLTCIIVAICILVSINLYKKMYTNTTSVENFIDLEDEKKKILDNLKKKNINLGDVKSLLQDTKQDYDSLKDKYTKNNQNFLKDIQSTLTKVDSINLTLDNEIDYIKTKLNGLEVIPVEKIKKDTEPTKYPMVVLSSVLPIKTYTPPPSTTPSSTTPSTETSTTASTETSTSISSNQPLTTPSSESSISLSTMVTPTSTSPSTSLSKFQDILNMNPSKIPVENFADDWRSVWDAKIPKIPDNIRFLNDTNPYITEDSTKFYFIKNPNLEANLNQTTSDIISLNMKKMTDNVRNKWINNYNKLYKN